VIDLSKGDLAHTHGPKVAADNRSVTQVLLTTESGN